MFKIALNDLGDIKQSRSGFQRGTRQGLPIGWLRDERNGTRNGDDGAGRPLDLGDLEPVVASGAQDGRSTICSDRTSTGRGGCTCGMRA